MASYTSSLIIKLIDRASVPSRAIAKALDGLNAAQQRNNKALATARGNMIDAAAMGFSLYKALSLPTNAAIDFQSKLEDIAQKVDIPVSALGGLGNQLKDVARDTSQATSEMAKGMDILAGMGANRSDALELLKPIGRTAFAYNASIEDLSQAGYAALDNLKVPANQLSSALDAMAQAGKAGAFELKDMAKYFPVLGAGYQALGQTGVPAVADLSAALQIVRKGTGDSASAATNLSNILQKMNAPLTQKNFAKMGVDLPKELNKAAKLGMTPIEAITEITNRTLKGDMSKLGYLFNDAQVQQGMRPLLQNLKLYREIRSEAMQAQGVVEEDYQRRLKTGEAATARFKAAIENLNLAVGTALLPILADAATAIVPLITAISTFANENPALTRAIVLTTAAVIGLRVATMAGQYGWLFFKGGVLTAQAALLTFTKLAGSGLLAPLRLALMGLTNPIGLVSKAFGFLRVALIGLSVGTGIGAILMALAVAGAWVYSNWEGISTAFIAFKDALSAALGPIMPFLQPIIDGLKWLWNIISSLVSPINASKAQWAQWGASAGEAVGYFIVHITEIPQKIWGAISSIPGYLAKFYPWFLNAGLRAAKGLSSAIWNGISRIPGYLAQFYPWFLNAGLQAIKALSSTIWNGIGTVVNYFATLPGSILRALGNLEISKALGIDGALNAAAEMYDSIGKFITSAFEAISNFQTSIMEKGGEFFEAGKNLMFKLWDGIKSVMKEIVEYIKTSISNAASAALSKLKSFFTFGSSGGDEQSDTPIDGARASGGPVTAGGTYLVGERGPELFSPLKSGFIESSDRTREILNNRVKYPHPLKFNIPKTSTTHIEKVPTRQDRVVTINLGGITMNLPKTENLDLRALATRISEMIGNQIKNSVNAAFSDGVY